MTKTGSTILIARFSALGDVAMTVPVVYSVCRANPQTRFVMVTRPSMTSIMVDPPANLRVVGVDLAQYKGVAGLIRLFRKLHAEYHFDAFADLHNVLRTKVLKAMCQLHGIPVASLNKARARRRALTRRRNKVMLPLTTQRARYREVFFRLGLTVEEHFRSLYGDGRGNPALFAEVAAPKRSDERWIAVAPFAKHPGKTYPPEQMRQVVEALVADDPATRVFLFGGGAERALLEQWANELPRTTSVAGRLAGFPAELSLLSYMDAMVSMDSANMHLASLVRVPVVAIWGATHPYCGFRAFRQNDTTAVQLSLACRPCSVFGNKPCHRGDLLCLTAIQPMTIVDKVKAITR